MKPKSKKRPPQHLSASSRRWWLDVANSWVLDGHHLLLLSCAASALDRIEQARQAIEAEGPFFVNRHNERKSHPALAVERDNKILFSRLLRELDLDTDPPPEAKRPPLLRRFDAAK